MSIILNNPHLPALKWGKFFMYNIDFKCTRPLGCPFCYNKLMDTNQDPTTEETVYEVARQANENKAKFLLISGGEPLASDMLFPTLDIMQPQPLETIIATNGDRISPGIIQEIAARGCTHIALSITEMYDFEMSIKRLETLEEAGFTVGISAVHTKANHGYFLQLVNTLAGFPNVTAITKQNICPHPLFDLITPTHEQSDEIAIGMYKLQANHPNTTLRLARRPLDNIALKPYLQDLPAPECGHNWTGGYTRILPNGDITNCVTYGEILGNVMTHNIKDIGKNANKLQKNIKEKCPYYQYMNTHHRDQLPTRG